jgi:hypothetical protein
MTSPELPSSYRCARIGCDQLGEVAARRPRTEIQFSYEVVAAVIGHEAGGKEVRTLTRHYVRTDLVGRKTKALQGRDNRLRQIISGATPPANVTPFPVGLRAATADRQVCSLVLIRNGRVF